MGLLSTALRSESASAQQLQTVGGGFFDFLGFGNTTSSANRKTALTISAFFNGVDQISNDVAKLPKKIYKTEGVNKVKYYEHPAYRLISKRPSGLMNAFELWKIVVISMILKGDAFVEIVRNGASGMPEKLIFREREDIHVMESGDKLYYRYKGRMIDGDDMLHFKGFTLDGKKGIGVVTFAAAQLGVILDSQSYAGEVYANKGLSYGVAETTQSVTVDAKKKLSDHISSALSSKNVHKVALLDEGMTYKSIAITPAEAQFLETNKNGVTEVARWLNIAPHKLKDLTNANYSNIYQQSIEHTQDSILPWTIKIEQECDNKLFDFEDPLFPEVRFNINALLRGDLQMKQQYYTQAIYSGYMNRNEIRAMEELNPVDGLEEYLQPVNMNTLEMVMQQLKDNQNGGNNLK